jgi:PilZ domain
MENRRQFQRTRFASRVKVDHPERGSGTFTTGDLSDGGIYLEQGPFELEIGAVVDVQMQGLAIEAPIVRMLVVRRDAMGYGLRFAG